MPSRDVEGELQDAEAEIKRLNAELEEAKATVAAFKAQGMDMTADRDHLRAALEGVMHQLDGCDCIYSDRKDPPCPCNAAREALRGTDQPAKGLDPYAHYPTIDGTNMTTEELATAFKLTTQTSRSPGWSGSDGGLGDAGPGDPPDATEQQKEPQP